MAFPLFFCALLIFLLLKLIAAPIRLAWKILINILCGYACLILIDLFSPLTGILLGINFINAAVIAVFGMPGIILLFLCYFIL